jgi:hypothetical protein
VRSRIAVDPLTDPTAPGSCPRSLDLVGGDRGLRYDERPEDDSPVSTDALPATPVRDRNITARAWREAPQSLRSLGEDLPGRPAAHYKRRIGEWLLWRAGPASGGDARYWAVRPQDLDAPVTFRLLPDGTGDGLGPDGSHHTRFRTWKESLLGREGAKAQTKP